MYIYIYTHVQEHFATLGLPEDTDALEEAFAAADATTNNNNDNDDNDNNGNIIIICIIIISSSSCSCSSSSSNAVAPEVKRAYRKLALKYHPDKNQGGHSAEEFLKARRTPRKGTNGVSTNGMTANFVAFDGTFWGTPVDRLSSSQNINWAGHRDPFSFLPFLAVDIAVTAPSSGQSGLTKIQSPANPFRRRPVAHPERDNLEEPKRGVSKPTVYMFPNFP